MIRVVLLGAGNVAQHLYTALLNQKHITVVQCYNRKKKTLSTTQNKDEVTNIIHSIKDADIYILAVSDDAIAELSAQLRIKNKLVVHTSGSVPIQAIAAIHKKGVFYPLQTFSATTPIDFAKLPICIEAENHHDLTRLRDLATSLTKNVYEVTSEQRNFLHVSAVFVNNFTNYLFSIGHEICALNDLPFEMLHPLITETAQKITKMNPTQAQTGPAVRKDTKTIARHLQTLSNPEHIEIYQMLTKAIQTKYGKKL
ncbi:DUF2520 domain-containing protein [Aquimarina sp. U1-2]|uniref:Rossmann-like and DUF2520 domain-containing protein n=1 Tax=Aquimarina sp. U1-2 TaxID=2823141 RepID=UPI001AECB81E|nr:DUF2520 domain-containing protein [Aquimarina sp. U1-2]MBP2832848.1 DUF2520 domain-containing protein [Aquimarina sp. U1-2]